MKIYLEGHDFKYAVEHIARLFFPDEKFEFISNKNIVLENQETFISSILVKEEGCIKVITNIQIGNSSKKHTYLKKYDLNLSSLEYNKLCQSAVRRCLFDAAQKIKPRTIPWGTMIGIRPTKIVHSLIEQGKDEKEIKKLLSDEYIVKSEKADLAIEVARRELKVLNQAKADHIGLYVGIPFCPTRCLYCSFISNSFNKAKTLVEPYIDALIKELNYSKEIIQQKGWKIESIYIGGGTPTSLPVKLLDKLLYHLSTKLDLSELKEFTIEAGRPDTINKEKLQTIKKYPINRLSINPQTMHQSTLNIIGRCHTPEDILNSFQLCREFGFSNINMDLIAGLPNETLEMFQYSLEQVERLNPENITIHTMSIKRASKLHEKLDQYELTQANTIEKMLRFAGEFIKKHSKFPYYMYRQKNTLGNMENVGYCKEGYECIYNIQMMVEKQTIISLGSGGVTKIVDPKDNRIERIFNVKEVNEYINRLDEMIKRKEKILSTELVSEAEQVYLL